MVRTVSKLVVVAIASIWAGWLFFLTGPQHYGWSDHTHIYQCASIADQVRQYGDGDRAIAAQGEGPGFESLSDAVPSATLDGTYFLVDAVYQKQQQADEAIRLQATCASERDARGLQMLLVVAGALATIGVITGLPATFGKKFAELWARARDDDEHSDAKSEGRE